MEGLTLHNRPVAVEVMLHNKKEFLLQITLRNVSRILGGVYCS
jgi:hypothetical protein